VTTGIKNHRTSGPYLGMYGIPKQVCFPPAAPQGADKKRGGCAEVPVESNCLWELSMAESKRRVGVETTGETRDELVTG